LLASVCDLKGNGGLWTNLSHVSLTIACLMMKAIAYLMASASIAQAIHGSKVRSRILRSKVGVWWKLHL
jgi:hypothetical protein